MADKQFVIVLKPGTPDESCIEVPEGKWVACALSQRWASELGGKPPAVKHERRWTIAGPDPAKKHVRQSGEGFPKGANYRSAEWQFVSDKPFGIIEERRQNDKRVGGLYFSCARQIHKGELGRKPELPRLPRFAREAPDREGHRHGWARFSEVSEIVGMKPIEFICRFAPFADVDDGSTLDFIQACDRSEIHGKRMQPQKTSFYHLGDMIVRWGLSPDEVWIREGFAKTVLYLNLFGYIPPLPDGE